MMSSGMEMGSDRDWGKERGWWGWGWPLGAPLVPQSEDRLAHWASSLSTLAPACSWPLSPWTIP